MAILIEDIALAFDSNDACRLAQITSRQLNHWDQLGIASPTINSGRGSGNRRAYHVEDVILLRLIRELRQFGVGLDVVADAIAAVRRMEENWLLERGADSSPTPEAINLAIGGDGAVAVGGRISSGLLPGTASMIVVRIDRIAEQIMRQVRRERDTAQLRQTSRRMPTFESPVTLLVKDSQRIKTSANNPPVIDPPDVEPLGEVGQFEAIASFFEGAKQRSKSDQQTPNVIEPNPTEPDAIEPVVVPDSTNHQADQQAADRTAEVPSKRPKRRLRSARKPQRPSGASAWGDAW